MLDLDEELVLDTRNDTETDHRFVCITSCSICAQACMSFAEHVEIPDEEAALARSVRLAEDCADVCGTTWRILVRAAEPPLEVVRALVEACAAAARACRAECERHASTSTPSASCAAACWVCADACDDLASRLAS